MEKAFNELKKSFNSSPKLKFKDVDCSVDPEYCEKILHSKISLKNKSSPLLLIQNDKVLDTFYGPQDFVSMRKYCLMILGFKTPRSLADAVATPSDQFSKYPLNSENFRSVTEKGLSLVFFHANWCGYCWRLKPIWAELGEFFKDHETLKLCSVDCVNEKQLCQKNHVQGFPTIYLFENGAFWKEYDGENKLDHIKDFAASHVNKNDIPAYLVREKEREIEYERHQAEKQARRELRKLQATSDATTPCKEESKKGLCSAV
jgi:thiol-disulfide isomerase/thioredoxin